MRYNVLKYEILTPFLDVNRCVFPFSKLIFLKTHKTGSTTLQNIILRYGIKNNLTFVLPNITQEPYRQSDDYKDYQPKCVLNKYRCHVPYHVFNEFRPFRSSWSEHYMERKNMDIFAVHSVWDNLEVRKLIPNGLAVTILRDPIAAFESSYSFYKNQPRVLYFQWKVFKVLYCSNKMIELGNVNITNLIHL